MSDEPYNVVGLETVDETADEHLVLEHEDRDTRISVPVTEVLTEAYDGRDLPETIDFDYVYITGNDQHGYEFGAEKWLDNGTAVVLKENPRTRDYEMRNYAGFAGGQRYIWERPFATQRVLEMLIKNGVNGTAALDFLMVDVLKTSRKEWAETRGISQQALSENYVRASEKLGPE